MKVRASVETTTLADDHFVNEASLSVSKVTGTANKKELVQPRTKDRFIRRPAILGTFKWNEAPFFSIDFIFGLLVQGSIYFILFLPRVWKAFYNNYCGGGRPATEQDCVRLILNSTLSMMVTRLNGHPPSFKESTTDCPDGFYYFRFYVEKCQLKLNNGDRLESIELVFAVDPAPTNNHEYPFKSGSYATAVESQYHSSRVISCVINKDHQVDEPAYILGVLFIYHNVSIHAKLHISSAALISHIEQHEKLKQHLAPSMIHTRALHAGLISTPFSPIAKQKWMGGWLFAHSATYQSVLVDEGSNWMDFRHDGLMHVRPVSPTIEFLWKARTICLKYTALSRTVTNAHELDQDKSSGAKIETGVTVTTMPPLLPMHMAECFFLTTVVHAVDHYNPGKFTENIQFPLLFRSSPSASQGIPPSKWQNFVCANALYQFLHPTLNPLKPNLLRYMDPESVYGKIYSELKVVNEELANVVTGSIMY